MPSTSIMPSVAVCGPLTRPPTESYLSEIRTFLLADESLQVFTQELLSLESTWDIVAGRQCSIAKLSQGPSHTKALSNWIKYGDSTALTEANSGIIAMPFLITIQITQYVQYLRHNRVSHTKFLDGLRAGGMQGYCAGLLAAFSIACARDESEVAQNAAIALRVGLMIGAYQELGDHESPLGASTMVLRLSYPGQGDEIVGQFPGCYISAVTDPKTVSIVGPAQTLRELSEYARSKGLLAQEMGLRGKVHNPENMNLAIELCELCDQVPSLQLPDVSKLRVTVNSNRTGGKLETASLTHEAVYTILTARCEWNALLEDVARNLKGTGIDNHTIACFGLGDCVPLVAFHQARLSITKIDVPRAVKQAQIERYTFNGDAIAIVGASCRLPGASSLDELWELMTKATSKCEPARQGRVPLEKAYRVPKSKDSTSSRRYYGNFLEDIDKFDHTFFRIGFKEAAYMDPQQRVLLELAYEALDSSGYLQKRKNGSDGNVGCFIGASMVEYLENTSSHAPTAFTSMGTIRAFLCGRLSYYFGWTGPAEVIDTACSSSLVAIHRACKAILGGECPVALAGGINLLTGVNNYLDLGKAGFLSPTGQCKPFDELADGYCRADGGGLVFLKKLSDAEKAGDQILGVITGTTTNQGGLSSSITVPHAPAQVELFKTVLRQSDMTADHVTYVEAHGTGTQAGDPIEISAIRQVLGGASRLAPIHIGSIKGNIGHCESAAGVAGLLKILSMLKFGKLPPLANFKKLNPKIPPLAADKLAIAQSTEAWLAPIRAACVNSYGAAGSNAAVLCCEYRRNDVPQSIQTLRSQSFPILISAHSKESLSLYMKQLATMLNRQGPELRSLAFTLSERRARHRFRWTTVARDITSLSRELTESMEVTESSQATKPIVLAFGGQTKQIVGLERSIYDTCPRFKHYVDTCQSILVELGFPPIIPAIFQATPIADVVVLQTATFAMQYSCAKCWIDSGLEVGVVIGHSFGELTALVVSGVWSLRDGLMLIATRAKLIATEWGVERGVMLAVHAFRGIVQDICRRVGDCEIACFNSDMNQVIVGSAKAIDIVQTMLGSESKYRSIRSQRLNVSHGFHSKFTEPLLDQLSSLAKTIPTNEAKIPLECCTAEQRDKISPDHIVRHIRDPVYFEDAVHRIEDRLGGCIWVEAGVDTPIIPMAKRALRNPDLHKFHPLSLNGQVVKEDVLPKATIALWNEGIDVSFWPFLNPKDAGLDQIPLPPYPFVRNTAWVENIDHATELELTKGGDKEVDQPPNSPPEPIRLVVGPVVSGEDMLFVINTESKRFKAIVSSHAVRGQPLCPASMYMECVIMAMQLSNIDLSIGTLCFEDLSFEHPLGIDPNRRVTLILRKDVSKGTWKILFQSSMRGDAQPRVSRQHAVGSLKLSPDVSLGAYHRMISTLMNQLSSTTDHEKLLATRAYGLFSQVVAYGEILRGIKSIILGDCQALAEVQLPGHHVNMDESTAVGACDAVSLDIVLQVAGLIVNTSGLCQSDSVYVATGLENVTLSDADCFTRNTSWKVYAKYIVVDGSRVTGDVFVFEPNNTLAVTVTGISFTKLPIHRLEKMLVDANPTSATVTNSTASSTNPPQHSLPSPKAITRSAPSATPVEWQQSTSSAPILTPPSSDAESSGRLSPATPDLEMRAKKIISNFTGASVEAIKKHTTMTDLGLDSLAAVEMADELAILFDREVSSMQLLECSFQDLVGVNESTSSASEGTSGVAKVRGPDVELNSDLAATFATDVADQDVSLDSSLNNISHVVGFADSSESAQVSGLPATSSSRGFHTPDTESLDPPCIGNPFEALLLAEIDLPAKAQQRGVSPSWDEIVRRQDEITVAYILEAFKQLGANLYGLQPDEQIPHIPHMPPYRQVIERYHHILQKHGLIEFDGIVYLRTALGCPQTPASELLASFKEDFPSYQPEVEIISIAGPRLADCFSGRESPISLLFRSGDSRRALENYYANSPALATSTELLVDLLSRTVAEKQGDIVRIMEVGAGFCGTTKRLAQELEAQGYKVEYTLTDVAPSLVAQASKTMSRYKWMKFETFNVENSPPASLRGKFDIVISTNCVHATVDRVASLRHVRELLNPRGFAVLSEGTCIADWYDIVFGLLDGWWRAGDGSYPLQNADVWMQSFKAAGFETTGCSQLPLSRLNTQSLILGSVEPLRVPPRMSIPASMQMETVVYKEVEGVQIPADIYMPQDPPRSAMSVAMMIHGGGHMTLSRKAIRPAQTSFLLENGVLPVSFDYRLCPQVNLLDGPIADIRDAYQWTKTELPAILERRGITIDPTRVAVIGWSTGGHLAMTTDWTSRSLGIDPPRAILSFYGPTDFESGGEHSSIFSLTSKVRRSLPSLKSAGHHFANIPQS
ncbi:BcPKS16, polyketide synthase [Hypoxylon sp. FL1857]|nr:BcPKS16, polyketide synthase [Hypoxylon sp. FL1857]